MGAPGTTEGPWKVASGAPEFICSDGKWIGCTMGVRHCDEARRNAHQMAASSALYDALAEAADMLAELSPGFIWGSMPYNEQAEQRDVLVQRAIAALALARGATPTPDHRGTGEAE